MDLEQINRERQKRGKRPLTRQEAERATASRPPGDDMDMFLLTYSTTYIDDNYNSQTDSRTETHHNVPDTGGSIYDTGSTSSDTGGGSDSGGGGDP